MTKRTCCVVLLLLTGVMLLVVGVLVVMFFQGLVDSMIYSRLPLADGSDVYKIWKDPPIYPIFKLYFFNVTNYKEFLELGEKAKLKETGPYVYRETLKKVNVSFNDNGTVSFRSMRTFHFDRSLSVSDENDIIVVPNVPMMTAVFQMQQSSKLIRRAISTFLDIIKMTPFVNKTVKELAWGYDDPLIKLAKQVMPNNKKFPYDKFGFFVGKNNTPSLPTTAWTGKDDLNQFLQIEKYDGNDKFTFWKTEYCNMYNGSDGTAFPPKMTNETTLYVFQAEFCRSLPLVFEKEVEVSGIPGYRFSPPDNVFDNPRDNPENDCFCVGGPPCAPSGLFNVSVCTFGAPVLLSWPHFYNGDPALLTQVEGVKPEREKHRFYMDVQPKMGLPLGAKGRMQLNVAMVKVEDVAQVANFQNVIFPILWFEDGIEELPDDILGMVKLAVLTPQIMQSAMTYVSFVVGGIILVCVAIYLARRNMSSKSGKIMDGGRYEMRKPNTVFTPGLQGSGDSKPKPNSTNGTS